MKYLVESYLPAAQHGNLAQLAARARAAADALADEGMPVRYLESILIPEDEMCLLVYEANSPRLAHEASGRAGIRCERVLEAVGGLDHQGGL